MNSSQQNEGKSGMVECTPAAHAVVEDKIRKQEIHYVELSRSIIAFHRTFLSEMSSLNKRVENIHTKLVGDLDLNGHGNVGWIQKVNALETESLRVNKNQLEIQKTIQKILPWFSVFKWVVLVTAPVVLVGGLTLFVGLLTGKIQIIM